MERKRNLFVIICILLVLIISGCGGKPLPDDLSAAGIDIGGMNAEDARQLLESAYSEPVEIHLGPHVLTLSPEESGAVLDAEALIRDAADGKDITWSDYLTLDTESIHAAVEAFCAELRIDPVQPQCRIENDALLLTAGAPGQLAKEDEVCDLVLQAYRTASYTFDWSPTAILPDVPDLQPLLDQVYLAPVDAVMDPDTFQITPGTDGYGFDISAALSLLDAAQAEETITIPLGPISPQISEGDLLDALYADVLAEWSSDCTDSEDRNTNLRLACEAVNGKILYPGDVFSYNETLGRRTAEKGYRPGPAYVGSSTVYVLGGGICQVSSALYYCSLVADLEIVFRTNHSYAQTYVPLGMDATVSWGTLDYKFRNNTDYPILIEAEVRDDQVHVTLKGTDVKDYYVKMEYEILSTTAASTTYKTYPADNSEGYTDGQIIVEPYPGYQVKTYRCKYDKQTDALISRTYEAYSYYHKRDGVICKIR